LQLPITIFILYVEDTNNIALTSVLIRDSKPVTSLPVEGDEKVHRDEKIHHSESAFVL